jgi:hypothetical protein
MRAASWAQWATCALAISICVPALADHARRSTPRVALPPAPPAAPSGPPPPAIRIRRSVAACTSFDQADKGDDKVELTIHNTCSIPVDCSVSWRLVCAPDSKKRRSAHREVARLAIPDGGSQSTEASAAVCGNEGWLIDSVLWRCEADKR